MLNSITLQGRLTRDPELRYTESQKPVCNFTLAVDRDREAPCDFIDVVAWNATADFVNKYFRKGQMMLVTGRLQTRKWEGRDGDKHTAYEVVADRVYFGEAKRDER